jgi:hypothetical protein
MKIYSFIAAVAVCILLASCSNDDLIEQNLKTEEFDTPKSLSIERDSLVGEPIPPKGKDE